jgi:hypothetical protein
MGFRDNCARVSGTPRGRLDPGIIRECRSARGRGLSAGFSGSSGRTSGCALREEEATDSGEQRIASARETNRRANRLFAGAVRNVQVEKKRNRLKVPALFRGTFTLLYAPVCTRNKSVLHIPACGYQHTRGLPSREWPTSFSRDRRSAGLPQP